MTFTDHITGWSVNVQEFLRFVTPNFTLLVLYVE